MLNNKVRAQSLVDSVTERLEAAILSGELTAGSKLSELQLAMSLGVSRGPLREAVRRLEGRKLLERTTNIGVRVVALSRRDVSEILEIQEALQGLACGLAAKNMSVEEMKALESGLMRYKHKPGKGEDYDSWDVDFHNRIIKGSGNERLSRILTEQVDFLLKVHRTVATTTRETAMRVAEDHKQIVAALKRRDSAAAEAAMREHIRHARVESLSAEFAGDSARRESPVAAPARKRARVAKLR